MKQTILSFFCITFFTLQFSQAQIWFEPSATLGSHNKKVILVNGNILEGNFVGSYAGFSLGTFLKDNTINLYLNYSPTATVSLKKEFAKVSNILINADYLLKSGFFAGVFVGHSSFELIVGPEQSATSARIFNNSPVANGLIAGVNLGYKKDLGDRAFLRLLLSNSVIPLEGEELSENIQSIEMNNLFKASLGVGFKF